ncbi:MAG: ATP-binding protein [Acidobacteriota bacterium]
MTTSAVDFLSLAEREASRYGGESLVFLRELLQNARDAGARRVAIETRSEDGVEAIRVTDDGRGMALDHARRFLLTLYASSKREKPDAAGRFGVGFWSILRFEASEITIRSRPAESEEGWEIIFDSGLEVRDDRQCRMEVGTTVQMERPARTGDLGALAWDLVRQDARHLRQKDDPETLLEVMVNGRRATERMRPEEPGLYFRRPGLRGAISLGSVSEVTLLAHGLRVRSASCVDDLLLRPGRRQRRSHRLPASGLSPRVVVDSDRLAVLMDRGDVAQDRALVAVARVIRSETRRLCEMELERLAPRSWWRKVQDAVMGRRGAIGLSVLMLIAAALCLWGASVLIERLPRPAIPGTKENRGLMPEPYIDRSSSYGGPVTETIDGVGGVPDLVYRPSGQRPYLAAFRVAGIDEGGKPLKSERPLRSAEGWHAPSESSMDFELRFLASGSLLRLPVPTGHMVEGESIVLNGHAAELWLTADDEPVLRLEGEVSGRIAYRTVECAFEGQAGGRWPGLPPQVARTAIGLKGLPPRQRIEEAIKLVWVSLGSSRPLENSNPDDSPAPGFFGQVFRAGGGDCDVVNTVLAAVLSEAGLRSRLAVGWIGAGGVPMAGLHAWVEVDLGGGRWVPADATVPTQDGAVVQLPEQPVERGLEERPEGNQDRSLRRAGLLGGGALLLGAAFAVWRLRPGREFKASTDLDPGPLVESLVRDREAWPGFAEARRRNLVPAHGVDRQSLAGIEEATSRVGLFVAESPGEWVERVREGGALVLDGSTRAGSVSAAAFGAFDLDRWQTLWRRSRKDEFGLQVQEALRRHGLKLELRFAAGVPGGVGLGFVVHGGAKAWVVIDDNSRDWRRCNDHVDKNRPEAIFRAADVVVGLLPLSWLPAQEALAELAESALMLTEHQPV